ncbi:PAS domain S-box protein, partial [Maricaulis sp.]|uniref:sensor histidine kinase n=1 Tax=Maricaulis sp. TaxID=1486257 RepID=UPI002629359A
LVVRGMAIGVWDWDIPANSLDWSPNALRILGLGPDHEVGDAGFFFDRVHPDDIGMMQDAIQRHFEHNEPYAPDFRIRHKDGHYVWCHATGQAILDEAGNPVRMAGSIQDITADRAINEARRKSEQRLRAITQSAVDAVLTTNAKGIIEQANPACEYIFGYRPDELVGSNIRVLTPTEHRRKHDYYIRHYIETGDSDIVGKVREVEGIHKDGHVIPIELAVTEYKAGDDRIFIATARDLTARKHAEAERENFIARLEETNAELERFNFAASHDLREPLRMIGNFSQLLLKNYREELDDDGRRALEICAGSAQRMQALLDDLISFSRASDDLGQIEAFMPADMIELAQQNLSDAMAASQATVHTVHLPGSFRANPTRFSRVFQNLISNSIKYAPDGETPRIQISAAPYEQGWLFTLSDNGIGMKPEYCEQIFEPFKRLHPASKYSGTGMGLAICRKIVNGAGGRIWAESQPGKGSRFYVYWPERQETDASVPANRQDEANGPAPAQHGGQA